VVLITLQPGESLKEHITPVDVLFYVLKGNGTVEIGDVHATVGKDNLIESPHGSLTGGSMRAGPCSGSW
jgi:quercetin dioxygenase-like cupin family protein